jgi:short-subunit dehydrogenase
MMDFRKFFQGKTVLITGAASGIGAEMARMLVHSENRLVLVDRDSVKLKALADDLVRFVSFPILCISEDVSDRKRMHEAARQAYSRFGKVDVVIANAGLGGLNFAFPFNRDIHDRLYRVNVNGLLNTWMPFVNGMIEKRSGWLAVVSSMSSLGGLPGGASYASSKAAQNVIAESFRLDLLPHGVKVTCVCPGFVQTAMAAHKRFDMPMQVSACRAADEILTAIAKGKAFHAFPRRMYWLAVLRRFLPQGLTDRILLSQAPKDTRSEMFGAGT